MPELTLFIISDLHVYVDDLPAGTSEHERPSWQAVAAAEIPGQHPLNDLRMLISKEKLGANYLICPGDIADKARPEALTWAWGWIKNIARDLHAETVVSTGNHDLDSRNMYNGHDAKGHLLELHDYPHHDVAIADQYWARSAILHQGSDHNILVLNSAAYHGYNDEFRHGRVSAATIRHIERLLDSADLNKLNLLVCHHHLYRYGTVDLDDYSEMTDGSLLLNLLGSGRRGKWLVIHGHRHWPNLEYAAGGAASPVVFAAGSFSAMVYRELQGKARNQCYELRVSLPTAGERFAVKGRYRSWEWVKDDGWIPAKERSGLRDQGGFGCRDADAVVDKIAGAINDEVPYLERHEIVSVAPDVEYLLPNDETYVRHALSALGLKVLPDGKSPIGIDGVGRP